MGWAEVPARLSADGEQRWESEKFSIKKNKVTGLFLLLLVRRRERNGFNFSGVISQPKKMQSCPQLMIISISDYLLLAKQLIHFVHK